MTREKYTLKIQEVPEPLTDKELKDFVTRVKEDDDFKNVLHWQVYFIAKMVEQVHNITGIDDYRHKLGLDE